MNSFIEKIMSSEEIQTMAKWACKFNCWEWPDDFPIAKPEGFDLMNHEEKFKNFSFRICSDGLKENVPEREVSKQWWLMSGHSEEGWLKWWQSGKQHEFLPKD